VSYVSTLKTCSSRWDEQRGPRPLHPITAFRLHEPLPHSSLVPLAATRNLRLGDLRRTTDDSTVDDLRYGPPSRYVWMIALGIGCTVAVVIGVFGLLIAVGVMSEEGPSDSVFVTALIVAGLLYAGFIAVHTRSLWNGVLVGILVPGVVVVGLVSMRNLLTADYGPCGPAAACSVSNAPGP